MKSRHGAHICIIDRNCRDLLAKTITTTSKVFSKIRSYNYINNLNNKNEVGDIEDIFLKNLSKKYISRCIDFKFPINKCSLLNEIFKRLRELKIYRVIILWEGEVILGKFDYSGCPPSAASFLKVGTNTGNYWELREFNIINNWYYKENDSLVKVVGGKGE